MTGPATVIEAIAAGHKAAVAIRRLVEEGPAALEKGFAGPTPRWELGLSDPHPEMRDRLHPPELPFSDREGFDEVDFAFSEKDAIEEASRCLRCGPCSECHTCVSTCARRHVLIRNLPENEGRGGTIDLLLRTPREGMPAEARLEEAFASFEARHSNGGEPTTLPVTVGLVKSRVDKGLCRGCGRCVEVCAFFAPALVEGPDGEPISRIDSIKCRGCGLCVSVCQTGAAEIEPFSKSWIMNRASGTTGDRVAAKTVVITCQRRGGCMTPDPESLGEGVDILRLSCVGQLEAGTILKLVLNGAERVIVAGCSKDRCRFESGAGIAADQVELARSMLKICGIRTDRVQSNWSEGREGDPLPLDELTTVTVGEGS